MTCSQYIHVLFFYSVFFVNSWSWLYSLIDKTMILGFYHCFLVKNCNETDENSLWNRAWLIHRGSPSNNNWLINRKCIHLYWVNIVFGLLFSSKLFVPEISQRQVLVGCDHPQISCATKTIYQHGILRFRVQSFLE